MLRLCAVHGEYRCTTRRTRTEDDRAMATTRARARRAPAACRRLREAAPVDALHPHGRLRRRRGPDHRPRRGLLRLGRARQPLPRRAARRCSAANLGHGRADVAPGRRRPGGRARLLLDLVLRASAGDRARGADRRRSRRATSTASSSRAAAARRSSRRSSSPRQYHKLTGNPHEDEGHRARDRLPRHLARRALGDGHHRAAHAVRAADARRLPRAEHEHVPAARGRRPDDARRGRRASASCSRARRRSPP